MRLIAVESATGPPLPICVFAFFGDIDADEWRTIVCAPERHRDALPRDPEVFATGVDQQPAVIGDGLLVARRPGIDERNCELNAAQLLLHRRVHDATVLFD